MIALLQLVIVHQIAGALENGLFALHAQIVFLAVVGVWDNFGSGRWAMCNDDWWRRRWWTLQHIQIQNKNIIEPIEPIDSASSEFCSYAVDSCCMIACIGYLIEEQIFAALQLYATSASANIVFCTVFRMWNGLYGANFVSWANIQSTLGVLLQITFLAAMIVDQAERAFLLHRLSTQAQVIFRAWFLVTNCDDSVGRAIASRLCQPTCHHYAHNEHVDEKVCETNQNGIWNFYSTLDWCDHSRCIKVDLSQSSLGFLFRRK